MKIRSLSYIIILLLFVALYFLNRKQVELVAEDNINLNRIGSSGYELRANIRLKNPNLLSSTIKSFHENIFVNGIEVGILDNELNQGIPGLKETAFPISVRFSKDEFAGAISADSTKPASVHIKGEIVFQNLFGGGTIKVDTVVPGLWYIP